MQRLSPQYPSGLPGLGLLELRLVLAGFLVADAVQALSPLDQAASPGGIAVALVLGACAFGIGLGWLTPFVQIAVIGASAVTLASRWWPLGVALGHAPWQTAACEAAIAANLMLIGPGAYSLEARLFGHREITIPLPPSSRSE